MFKPINPPELEAALAEANQKYEAARAALADFRSKTLQPRTATVARAQLEIVEGRGRMKDLRDAKDLLEEAQLRERGLVEEEVAAATCSSDASQRLRAALVDRARAYAESGHKAHLLVIFERIATRLRELHEDACALKDFENDLAAASRLADVPKFSLNSSLLDELARFINEACLAERIPPATHTLISPQRSMTVGLQLAPFSEVGTRYQP